MFVHLNRKDDFTSVRLPYWQIHDINTLKALKYFWQTMKTKGFFNLKSS